ncbi:MAG: cadherin-like domain-containing protein [Alphaproteobacteria bacterium]|nr:cadherin-like domain-containing protein [Alphaproteobacteria bacterium]
MRAKWLIGALAILPVLPALASTTYVYDNLGRVWTVTYDNGLQVTYTYDAAGNRTAVVTQTGSNRPPQANNDYVDAVTNTQTPVFHPLDNDFDPDGNGELIITALGATTQGGTTTLSAGKDVTYTPPVINPPFRGLDTFTYTISDGHGHTASATVYAAVSDGTPPIAVDDSYKTPLNVALTGANALDVMANDSEPNPPGYTISLASVTSPTAGGGTAAVNGNKVNYTPATDYEGQDTFTYTITDGHQHNATAAVSVFVGTPPTAVDDYQPVALNTPTSFDPRQNDLEPNHFPLQVTAVGGTAHGGSVSIDLDGKQLTYTPPTSTYNGADSFTYTVSNGHGLDATATDHMCVGTAPPTAVAESILAFAQIVVGGGNYVIPQGSTDARSNNSDPCGSALGVTAVTQGAKGSARINLDGTITYVYGSKVYGQKEDTDSFTYTITSAFGQSATGTVNVTIDVETKQ